MRFIPTIGTLCAFFLFSLPAVSAQFNWTFNPTTGHWYSLTSSEMSWNEARFEARTVGGYLTTVNDVAESNWLWAQYSTAEVNSHGPWIGLWQNQNSPAYSEPLGGWEWTNGEPVTFTIWDLGEPNDAGGDEHFAHMHGSCCRGDDWNDAEEDLFGGLWGVIEIDTDPSLLLQVTNLAEGGAPIFKVTGATQGDSIGIGFSLNGGGPWVASTPCGPISFELSSPINLLGVTTADATGTANIIGPIIPVGAFGTQVWFDALNLTTCISTPGVTEIIL